MSPSIFANTVPTLTSVPGCTKTSFTVPETSVGISIEALSDSNTRIVSPLLTVSPTLTEISLTSAPSMPSPRSGNIMSIILLFIYTSIGFGLSGSILYLSITLFAVAASNFLFLINARITFKVI